MAEAKKIGITILITQTSRLAKEQLAYWMRGRKPYAEVVNYYKSASLIPPTKEENKVKITWTLNSKHIVDLDDNNPNNDLAKAFDFVVLDKNGKAVWKDKADINADNLPDYRQVGEIAERLGVKWGGRFGDPPHVETK
jgi:hypothetical protein